MSDKKRLFVGLFLPPATAQNATLIQQYVATKLQNTRLRLTPKDNLHLTVCFLGDVESDMAAVITRKLEKIGKTYSSISLEFSEISIVESNLWIEFKSNDTLSRLVESVRDETSETLGINPKQHEFIPHITIGRFTEKTTQTLPNFDIELNPLSFSEFGLYSSTLQKDAPPLYEQLATIPFSQSE